MQTMRLSEGEGKTVSNMLLDEEPHNAKRADTRRQLTFPRKTWTGQK
jgi:hypothetical protein